MDETDLVRLARRIKLRTWDQGARTVGQGSPRTGCGFGTYAGVSELPAKAEARARQEATLALAARARVIEARMYLDARIHLLTTVPHLTISVTV